MKYIDKKDKLLLLFSIALGFFGGFMLIRQDPEILKQRIASRPIARLNSHSNLVKKKNMDSVSWGIVRKNNKFFHGDQIFTHKSSYAEIIYLNSTSINLLPNTLLKIEESSSGLNLDLKKGFLTLDFNDKKTKSINLKIGKKKIELSATKASIQISTLVSSSNITVLSGNATVSEAKLNDVGKEETILKELKPGNSVNLQEDLLEVTVSEISPVFPSIGQKISGEDLPIEFSWKSTNIDNKFFEFLLSGTPDFIKAQKFKTNGTTYKVDYLTPGVHYWKIKSIGKPEGTEGPVSYFIIAKSKPPSLTIPKDGQDFLIQEDIKPISVNFTWNKTHIENYIFSISSKGRPTKELFVKSNSIALKFLKTGSYSWKVKSNEVSQVWSAARSFSVKYPPYPSPPLLGEQQILKLQKGSNSEQYAINWKEVKYAKAYMIEIYDTLKLQKKLISDRVGSSKMLWKGDRSGVYYYRVKVIDYWGRESKWSEISKLISPISPFD
jgi:hypothetical protein